MIWIALSIGALAGLGVGWRAGRLHLIATQGYTNWRGAVNYVPVAYRGAVHAIKNAVSYMLGITVIVGIIALVVWNTNR